MDRAEALRCFRLAAAVLPGRLRLLVRAVGADGVEGHDSSHDFRVPDGLPPPLTTAPVPYWAVLVLRRSRMRRISPRERRLRPPLREGRCGILRGV